MIKVVSRKKCLLLIAIALALGAGTRPTADYFAAKTMDPKMPITEKDQRRIAIHEAGHAVAAQILNLEHPPTRIEIDTEYSKSSTNLGVTVFGKGSLLPDSSELFDGVVKLMASMAAEAIVLGNISTGHSNDLARANSILAQMCGQASMCGSLIVRTGGPDLEVMVNSHLVAAYHRASVLIQANKDIVLALADLTLAQPIVNGKRTLNARQLVDFFGSHKVEEVPPESRQIAPIVNEVSE